MGRQDRNADILIGIVFSFLTGLGIGYFLTWLIK